MNLVSTVIKIILLSSFFGFSRSVIADPQEEFLLPLSITKNSAQVSFKVESTWHTVSGSIEAIKGEVWRENNSGGFRAEIDGEVKSFKTGLGMRDRELYKVMAADKYPSVHFSLASISGEQGVSGEHSKELCKLSEITEIKPCLASIDAFVTIRGVKKPLRFSGTFKRVAPDRIKLVGKGKLNWAEFGVEDPSILIAKLDKEVRVRFSVEIPTHL
jgi:polyisoprenoid-binding protein YceI